MGMEHVTDPAELVGALRTARVRLDHGQSPYIKMTGAVFPPEAIAAAEKDQDIVVPVVPGLDGVILAQVEARPDTFSMEEFETPAIDGCETTHCRAGWAVHFAGEAGRVLKRLYGYGIAGALIYAKSCPGLPVPDFYSDAESYAIADMRRRAAVAAVTEGSADARV